MYGGGHAVKAIEYDLWACTDKDGVQTNVTSMAGNVYCLMQSSTSARQFIRCVDLHSPCRGYNHHRLIETRGTAMQQHMEGSVLRTCFGTLPVTQLLLDAAVYSKLARLEVAARVDPSPIYMPLHRELRSNMYSTETLEDGEETLREAPWRKLSASDRTNMLAELRRLEETRGFDSASVYNLKYRAKFEPEATDPG